ncbi:hypothetical protein OG401_14240 [Kitasatospora purpeofusca]|uniref:hypothetical protein n=1 Tax=Kitasatospora purpeofusca TaxID=67352 RepID=UPI00225A4829|nr:hypothetical protein [Kitasatospora purpeofusca]MCX4685461.1 hypothetical protein [Kitasatospora purpeofusca]
MLAMLGHTSPSKTNEVAAQIADSKTVEVRVSQTENLVIAHSMAVSNHHIVPMVIEYWDIVYNPSVTDAEINELVALEERVFVRYGIRLERMVVEREENKFPHPWFTSDTHTYVRLCPKVAV